MGIVDHVGCDEDPLWDSGSVHIGSEVVEVPDAAGTLRNADDGVVKHWGVVLANIIDVWGSRGVEVVGLGVAGTFEDDQVRRQTLDLNVVLCEKLT